MVKKISEARIREIVQEELVGPMVSLAGVVAENIKNPRQGSMMPTREMLREVDSMAETMQKGLEWCLKNPEKYQAMLEEIQLLGSAARAAESRRSSQHPSLLPPQTVDIVDSHEVGILDSRHESLGDVPGNGA